jgi:hypothetical protein
LLGRGQQHSLLLLSPLFACQALSQTNRSCEFPFVCYLFAATASNINTNIDGGRYIKQRSTNKHQHDAIDIKQQHQPSTCINNDTSTSNNNSTSTTTHQHSHRHQHNLVGLCLSTPQLVVHLPSQHFIIAIDFRRHFLLSPTIVMFQPSPWPRSKEMSLPLTFESTALISNRQIFGSKTSLAPTIVYPTLVSMFCHLLGVLPKEMSLSPTTDFNPVVASTFSPSPWPHSKEILLSPVAASLEVPQPSTGVYGPLVSFVLNLPSFHSLT